MSLILGSQPQSGLVTEAQIRALGPKIWLEGRAMRGTPTAIDRWIDLSGNNNHATAAANHPSVSSDLCNGKPAVRFVDTKEMVLPAVQCRNAWVVAKCDNVVDNNIWLFDGTNHVGMTAASLSGKTFTSGFGGSTDYGYSKAFTAGVWRMYTFSNQSLPHYMTVLPQVFTTMGVDGMELLQTSAISSFSPTILGGYNGTTYDCNASIAAVIHFDRTMAQWERDLVSRYLEQQFGLTLPRHNRLFTLGDSLTAVGSLTIPDTYAYKLLGTSGAAGLLGQNWTGIPYAASGWTAQELSMMCEPALAMASSLCNNVAVVFIGTNNGSPETAASVADRVADICLRARTYGCRTLIVPMLPKGDGSSETWRQDFNTAQANIVAAGKADRIIPQSDQPLLWNAGAQNNATYFNADKLHLVAAGQTLLSAAAAPHIQALATFGSF